MRHPGLTPAAPGRRTPPARGYPPAIAAGIFVRAARRAGHIAAITAARVMRDGGPGIQMQSASVVHAQAPHVGLRRF
ncbi:hypothetical protein [Streptomyces platensis]|uniref:hypothetical protein n=1 Tax=Streptomyces platensis TaxID=58346 RepID=UPI0036B63C52